MQIQRIRNQLFNNISIYRLNSEKNEPNSVSLKSLKYDTFIKNATPVSFGGGVIFENNDFEKQFPRSFFKKLTQEGLPCAYTGVRMIPRADVDALINMQVLNKKSEVAIRYLKPYKDCFYENSNTTQLKKPLSHSRQRF